METSRSIPGARADIVLVLHRDGDRASLLSIPRDLLIDDDQGTSRLALTLSDGPQRLVDGLCTTLGVAADHLVLVDLGGFLDVAEALGPLEITTEHRLRDLGSGLALDEVARQELDPDQALALVRSRHPEELVAGAWIPAGDGPVARAGWAATVFEQLADRAADARTRPITLARAGWALSDAVTLDDGTSLRELLDVVDGAEPAGVLETEVVGTTDLRLATAAGLASLRSLGIPAQCTPSTATDR